MATQKVVARPFGDVNKTWHEGDVYTGDDLEGAAEYLMDAEVEKPLEGRTKAQLLEEAQSRGLEVSDKATKAEILAQLGE